MKKLAIVVLIVMIGSLVSPFATFASASKEYTIRVYNDGFDNGGKVTVVLYDNNWNLITSKYAYVSSSQDYTDVTFYLDDGDYNFEVYYTPNDGQTEYWGAKSFNVCSWIWCGSSTEFHRNWPYEDHSEWTYFDSNHDSISTSVTITVPGDAAADSFSVYYKIEAKNINTGKIVTDQSPSYDISKGTTRDITDPYTKLGEAGTYQLTYYIYAKASWGNKYVLVDQVNAGTVVVPEVIGAEVVSHYFNKGDLAYGDSGTATVQIKNTGNVRTTFSIALKYYKDGTSTKYTIDTKSVTLDPGQTSSDISFTYTWDELYNHGGAGTYKMYFEVTKYGSSAVLATGPEASITVEAPKVSASVVYFEITDSILTPTSPYNTGIAAVRVKNTGDVEETFHVALVASSESSGGLYKIDSTDIQLEPGETSYTLNLKYTYDELKAISGPGNYELYAIVYKDSISSPLDTSNKETVTVEEPRLQFEITEFALDKSVYYVGDNITATVTIKNTGNIKGTISVIRVDLYITRSQTTELAPPKREITLDPGQEITLTFHNSIEAMNLVSGTYTAEAHVIWSYKDNTKEYTKTISGIEVRTTPEFELAPPFSVGASWNNNSAVGVVNPNEVRIYFNASSGFWHGYSKHGVLLEGMGEGISITSFYKSFTSRYTGDYYLKVSYDYAIGYTLGVFDTQIATAAGQVFSGFNILIVEKDSGNVVFRETKYLFNYANPEYIDNPNAPIYSSVEWGTEVAHEWMDHWMENVLKKRVLTGALKLSDKAAESVINNAEIYSSVAVAAWDLADAFKSTVSGTDMKFNAVYIPEKPVHLEAGKKYVLLFIPFEVDRAFSISTLGGASAMSYSELAIKLNQIDFTPSSLEDTVPPQLNITSYPADGVLSHTKFMIAWNSKDDLTPSSGIEYSWKLKGYDSTWSSWSHDTSVEYSLPPGHYLFQIRAKDASGNIAYKSIPITVYPKYNVTITTIRDESGDAIMPRAGENIYVTVHNYGPDAGSIRVIIAVTKGLTMHPPYEQIVYLNPRESKTLTFYVSPNDNATLKESVLFAVYNNETGKLLDVKTYDLVVQPKKENVPPKIVIISPSNGSSFKKGDPIYLKFNVSDDSNLSKIEITLDGNPIYENNNPSNPYVGNLYLSTSTWSVGSHTIKVTAYDNQEASSSNQITIYVYQTNISAPTIKVISPLNRSKIIRGEKILLKFNVSSSTKLSKIEIWLDKPGETLIDSISSININEYSYQQLINTTTWKRGWHKLIIIVTDSSGQETSISLHINIEPCLADYTNISNSFDTVYILFKNYQSMDYAVSVPYLTQTMYGIAPKFRFAGEFISQLNSLTDKDIILAIGGPLVNAVTKHYENNAYVHMDLNNLPYNITIVTPHKNITWRVPQKWWNVSEGYFIIQMLNDPNTSALVITIYGTDMDSTAAGAYYFSHYIYPDLDKYIGIGYLVGLWEDTQPGADYELPGRNQGDTSGFSSGDTITIVDRG